MLKMLNREFKITSETALQMAINFIKSNWEPLFKAETPLFLIVTNAEEKRRSAQNRYYWKVIIQSIASQAWVDGRQFDAETWHEYLAGLYAIKRDLAIPDGSVVIKRLSTSEMKVREFSEYIEKCSAYGAQELAVRFPAQEQY